MISLLLACEPLDPSAEVRALLDEEIAASQTIFQIGCDEAQRCQEPGRQCVTTREPILDAHSNTGRVAIEWEATGSQGYYTQFWFIDADGGGRRYYYVVPDTGLVEADCWSWCGWHKADQPTGSMISGGVLTLPLQTDPGPDASRVLESFVCGEN